MDPLEPLSSLLAEYELYEPELGDQLRESVHLRALVAGHVTLSAWETTPLTYLHGPKSTATYQHLVQTLGLPEPVRAALQKQEQPDRYNYYWNHDYSERMGSLELAGSTLKLRYSNRKGHYSMEAEVPRLTGAKREAAERWLSQRTVLSELARGEPLKPETLAALDLPPVWGRCKVSFNSKNKEALELGAKFFCCALTIFPAYLLILRGLSGDKPIRVCVEAEVAQRRADFEAAAAGLPVAPSEFWAAAPLPDMPLPHEVVAGEGLGIHLPPANFWARPEDNRLFMDALLRTYKNIPRKLARLTTPRRW